MNAAMTLENLGLQHDNKQLNALIKEYEQTLETLMSESTARLVALHDYILFNSGSFRNRAVSSPVSSREPCIYLTLVLARRSRARAISNTGV